MSKNKKVYQVEGLTVEGGVITSGDLIAGFSVSTSQEAKDAGESSDLEILVKLSGLTVAELLKGWWASARIKHQHILRDLSATELEEYSGTEITWQELGKKVASRTEKVASLQAQFGLDSKTAEWAADNPEEFQKRLSAAMKAMGGA